MSTDIWNAISAERLRLADDLSTLQPGDWSAATRCDAWNVKQIASHLVLPFMVAKPKFVLRLLRNRRNVEKTIAQLTAKVDASNTSAQIISSLRDNADSKWKPPGTGPEIPLGEIVVHGQDIRHAVGLPNTIPTETVKLLLDSLSDPASRADYSARIAGDHRPTETRTAK